MSLDEVQVINDGEHEATVLSKINELKSLRSSTKGNITRIKTMIAKKGPSLATEELHCRLGILESYFKQFLSVQASLDKLGQISDSTPVETIISEIEETFVLTKSRIMAILSQRKSSVADVSNLNTTAPVTVAPRVRRDIKLPTFSGKYSEYPKFIALFNKLIHQDEAIENCERFLILKEHLSSKALACVEDFDVTDENYPKALNRLKECFDKKALMFQEHISALFSISKSTKASASHLRNVVNSVNAHLSAMLSLGTHEDIINAMLIHITMEKLDEKSQIKWEESVDYSKMSTWEECSTILTKRCENLEARESKVSPVDPKEVNLRKDLKNKRHSQTSLAIEKSSCKICNGSGHELSDCNIFKGFSLKERYNAARKTKVCFTCLKRGHLQKDCSAAKCPKCNLSHHQLLHKDYITSDYVKTSNELPSTSTQVVARSAVMNVTAEPEVLLATAVVLVRDNKGKYHRARAILDSGSQVNLMCENLAQKLLLKKTVCKLNARCVGDVATNFEKQTVATIKSRVNEYELSLEFFVLPKITGSKPDHYFDISGWNLPKNITLADPMFNHPARVDMLIGAEIFFDLLSVGRIHLEEKLPILQKSILGWIVAGRAKEGLAPTQKINSFLVNHENQDGQNLNKVVEQFWKVEQIASQSKFLTEEEKECEQIFINSVQRDSSGRFITKIPFKSLVNDLGSSYSAAERRMLSLERKLKREHSTRNAYNAFMSEYLALGHMTLVNEVDMNKIKYFAPHQHVLRPDSTSTKLRVVFDCSCKTDSGLSLNEVMMKGPVVQDDLLSIVLRFRCYKYAITADVTKMYRQAWVTDSDSNYQAILWRSSPEEKLKAYRLRTITYGTTSAPYLATRCLKKLGEDFITQFPVGSKKILSDFYMDDLITGANDEDEIFVIYDQVSAVMNSAKFTLRKWFSNSEKFLKVVPEADKEKTLRLNDEEIIKTLGIIWVPKEDIFRYVWPETRESKSVTKRIVLAKLSSLFNPLGLINPLIVKAKIFMQDLWILKVNWDESLPMNLHSKWIEFREKLRDVKKISIPRCVFLAAKNIVKVEMHGFSDASKRAFGCCVYIRTICANNDITVQLWSAKSRVAPLKTQSLPKLELLGAELLSKLVTKTKSNCPINIDAFYMWTDSEIVLDWLSEHPSNWNTFVANRVSFIQEETKSCIWRHVPSKANPADIISRGAYIHELTDSIWFSGPEFLKKSGGEWPPNKARDHTEANRERSRSGTTLLANCVAEKSINNVEYCRRISKPDFLIWIETFSDFEKLQRIFINLLRFRKRNNSTINKLDEAMIRIIYCVQQFYFLEEYALLRNNHQLVKSKYKSLDIFIEDTYGVPILRVGGRLANAAIPYDAKHQILLPNNSKIVENFVRLLHMKHLHAGTQALMAIIRQRFWIVHARAVVRKITSGCLQCFRCRPKLGNQVMGDLPPSRVAVAKPFTVTGVDFCGPVITTYKLRGCRTTKSYIAVFICFATKAVHMEVVTDLTAKAFLAALKRFVARRGLCSKLYCGNATNFVGTRRELKELKSKFFEQQVQGKISNYCVANSIEFHHIPPRSPHFGGLWEAAVKSAKYHLSRILGQSYLTFEELSTVVAEIEALLNSRPLTSMSNDPNDEKVLTPAHFLVGGPLVGISEPTVDSEKWSRLDRWLRISAIQQHFWKRWSLEYLHELQQKVKWTKRQRNVKEGELVLVADENLPPKQWLIGRIVSVTRDAKGFVRVANVKTKNGELRRAIHKLAPIPFEG